MSSPNQQSLAKLKRLARYLKRERQWGQVLEYGKMAEELTVFTDSDWAGCKETRKSSSAGVLMLGGHSMKAHTRKEAKATEHIFHRQGIGKLNHIDVALLVGARRNQIAEIASAQNQK